MSEAARARLAKSQAELVRALVAQGAVPVGFDEKRVHAAARSLVSKRRQTVARVWPSLVRSVGDSYSEAFANYAQAEPLPAGASGLADGRAFLCWLESQGPMGDAARLEAMAFDLRYAVTPTGLRARHGFAVKLAKLRETPGLVIAARVPWLGERWWGIPRK